MKEGMNLQPGRPPDGRGDQRGWRESLEASEGSTTAGQRRAKQERTTQTFSSPTQDATPEMLRSGLGAGTRLQRSAPGRGGGLVV